MHNFLFYLLIEKLKPTMLKDNLYRLLNVVNLALIRSLKNTSDVIRLFSVFLNYTRRQPVDTSLIAILKIHNVKSWLRAALHNNRETFLIHSADIFGWNACCHRIFVNVSLISIISDTLSHQQHCVFFYTFPFCEISIIMALGGKYLVYNFV